MILAYTNDWYGCGMLLNALRSNGIHVPTTGAMIAFTALRKEPQKKSAALLNLFSLSAIINSTPT